MYAQKQAVHASVIEFWPLMFSCLYAYLATMWIDDGGVQAAANLVVVVSKILCVTISMQVSLAATLICMEYRFTHPNGWKACCRIKSMLHCDRQ